VSGAELECKILRPTKRKTIFSRFGEHGGDPIGDPAIFSPCRAGVIRVPPAKCGTNTTSKQASTKLISHRIFAGWVIFGGPTIIFSTHQQSFDAQNRWNPVTFVSWHSDKDVYIRIKSIPWR
jgi:hypothetical protein